jgi:hypothetical protein
VSLRGQVVAVLIAVVAFTVLCSVAVALVAPE